MNLKLIGESQKGKNLPDNTLDTIAKSYEAMLTIPKHKPTHQFFLCPVGLVGAGKTTVTKPLAKMLQLIRISTDEIRKLLKKNSYNYQRVHELAFRLIHKYTDQGYSIAIDANCADPKILNRISSLTHRLRAKVIWIHIDPPESFILNKLRTHKHSWLFKDENQAIDNYFTRKALHKIPKVNFVYTFDTSRADLDTQISEAVKVINNMM